MEKQKNPNDMRMTLRLPAELLGLLKDLSYTSNKTVNQVVLEAIGLGLKTWVTLKYPDGKYSEAFTVSLNLKKVNKKLAEIQEEIFRWGEKGEVLDIFVSLEDEEE
ncbi:MAG: hypothetical protein ACXAB2_14420 [Candidatus Hodarchaeales archaeon]|jgi:hypothetical protein